MTKTRFPVSKDRMLCRRISTGLAVMLSVSVPIGLAIAADADLLAQARQIFQALPKEMTSPENPITPEKVAVGRLLYFEPRVSLDGTTSCARCHQPALYGSDALPRSIGVLHRVSPRNAQTVLNAALHIAAHWRGDRKSFEDQATQALLGPPSFGHPNYETAMARLRAIAVYPALFAKAFPGEPDPITPENWGKAIGAFERTLVTPSRFDAFLMGDTQALSPTEQAGLREFIGVGCASCHNGVGVGGGMYRKFGVFENYWEATGRTNPDKGRFDVTHDPADMYAFKVASLRNVAKTPPYFHDGSVATLPEAVRIMGRVQLGTQLSPEQIGAIVAFLESLTGLLPTEFAVAPVLPEAAFQETSQNR